MEQNIELTDVQRKIWKDFFDGNEIVVDGCCFHIGPENQKGGFRGCSGAKFKLKITKKCCFAEGSVITTTNLWIQGRIPKPLIDEMKIENNAEFVKEEGFSTIDTANMN